MQKSMPLAIAFCAAPAPNFFGFNSSGSIAPGHPSAYTASALVKKTRWDDLTRRGRGFDLF
jgi:hypothetical protein